MIDWDTRTYSRAQIYLPAIKSSNILAPSLPYVSLSDHLTRVDDYMPGCHVSGITDIPVPSGHRVLRYTTRERPTLD